MTGVTYPVGAWPFWAPLGAAEIADAIALADVRPGERFLDLGCGDGRVMAAALNRGAQALGYEIDGELAMRARERLAGASGGRARVIEESFFDAPLDAEVVFAYLSPAVLQRLSPQLKRLPAASRIVTAWFDIPGWASPVARRGNLRRYAATSLVPAHASVPLTAGWASPGLLCAVPATAPILVTTSLTLPQGPVAIAADNSVADFVGIATGTDSVATDLAVVAVDLVLAPCLADTTVTCTLHAPGAGTCELYCFASTTFPPGFWPIDAAHCARLRAQFAVGPS